MIDQDNENEEFFSSEESLISEPETDELDEEGENKIYLWLSLSIVVILVLSYLYV